MKCMNWIAMIDTGVQVDACFIWNYLKKSGSETRVSGGATAINITIWYVVYNSKIIYYISKKVCC